MTSAGPHTRTTASQHRRRHAPQGILSAQLEEALVAQEKRDGTRCRCALAYRRRRPLRNSCCRRSSRPRPTGWGPTSCARQPARSAIRGRPNARCPSGFACRRMDRAC
eukprot:2833308-Prymnesium_polylepis.3